MNRLENSEKCLTLSRILIPATIGFALLLASYFIISPVLKQVLIKERKQQAQQMVLSLHTLVEGYYNLAISGGVASDSAQRLAKRTISSMRYGRAWKDYFWVLNSNGSIVSHPYLKGVDSETPLSAERLEALQRMSNLAAQQGEGFVEHTWQWHDRPDTDEKKISYIKRFGPWGWILGTGFYPVDVEGEISKLATRYSLSILGIIVILMTILGILMVRSLRTIGIIKQREAEFVRSESLFRGMAQNIESGLIILQGNTISFFNNRMCEILGVQPEMMKSCVPEDFVPPEESGRFNAFVQSMRGNEQLNGNFDLWITTGANARRFLTNRVSREQRGGVWLTYILSMDVTERKQADAELIILSETLYQSPSSIVITDLNWRIEYVNREFELSTGYTAKEVLGRHHDFLVPDSPTSPLSDVQEHSSRGHTWMNEVQCRRKNGELYWEDVKVFPVRSKAGDVVKFAAIKSDITKRKQLELELVSANERTRESDRLKTTLLNNISHEVNTPLNAIYGFANLLKDEVKNNDRAYSYSQFVVRSTKVLQRLFNDILEFSIIESGGFKLRREDIRITHFIHKVVSRHNTALATECDKDLEILVDRNPNLDKAILSLDRRRLTQVFDKLISNAIKFTQKGFIRIGYSINAQAIEFYVEDTGIGIPEEEKAIIFESFAHGSSLYISQHKGAGLGLNITKMLIERMGGKLWFSSEPGQGTTFYFSFPSIDVRNYTLGQETVIANPYSGVLRNKVVLVAEDSDECFIHLKALIGSSTTTLLWARNGQEAIDIAMQEGERVDVAIIDTVMPILSGLTAARTINKRFPAIPMLAIVSDKQPVDEHDLTLFRGTISKPFLKNEIFKAIHGTMLHFRMLES